MSAPIDFAEGIVRALRGQRCTLALATPEGRKRTLTGKVRGLCREKDTGELWFRFQARDMDYCRLSLAPQLRKAPMRGRK